MPSFPPTANQEDIQRSLASLQLHENSGRQSSPHDDLHIDTSPTSTSQKPVVPVQVTPPTPASTEPTERRSGFRRKISEGLGSLLHRRGRSGSTSSVSSNEGALPDDPEATVPPRKSAVKEEGDKDRKRKSSLHSLINSASGVKLVIVNQTGLPLQLAEWPVAAEEGEVCASQTWKGSGIVRERVPDAGEEWKEDQEVVEAGVLRKPVKKGLRNDHTHGWVYFDILVQPPPMGAVAGRPYRIHSQLYLRLSTSGSAVAKLGRFDLDSSLEKPMPSGEFGRVEVVRARPAFPSQAESSGSSFSKHNRNSSSSSISTVSSFSGKEGRVEVNEEGKDTKGGDVVEVRYFVTKEVAEMMKIGRAHV